MNPIKMFRKGILLIFSMIVFSSELYSQVNWVKYESNPVFTVGEPGTWESNVAGILSVIYHEGIYNAWYVGIDDTDTGRIGYATSTDGISWEKYENNPVLILGNQGEWDDHNVDHCCVLLINDTFKMWYMGENESSARIGYATSNDGKNWVKYAENPVLDLGPLGSWDENEVMHPNVIYDGSNYHLWYNGYGQNTQRTGYATSSDGINWIKHSGNPVLTTGAQDSWDDYMLALMSVIYLDNEFKMWYTAGDGTDGDAKHFRIGYATSANGVTWTKHPENPVLDIGEGGAWDNFGVVTSSVIYDSIKKIYKMWYGGIGELSVGTGYATSDPITNIYKEREMAIPDHNELKQNYPNPFNPQTTIKYHLKKSNDVKLKIFNLNGQEIEILINKYQKEGEYQVNWKPTGLSSGIYFYSLQAGEYSERKKLIFQK